MDDFGKMLFDYGKALSYRALDRDGWQGSFDDWKCNDGPMESAYEQGISDTEWYAMKKKAIAHHFCILFRIPWVNHNDKVIVLGRDPWK